MVTIKIPRDMLLEDLYVLRSHIDVDNEEARKKINEIIAIVSNAPVDDQKSTLPRISVRGS